MTLLVRSSIALGLTSFGLLVACGDGGGLVPSGSGGVGNPGSGGAVNTGSGAAAGVGGNTGTTGGATSTGGTVGSTGGATSTGGTVGSTGGTVGSSGGSGPDIDANGKENASPGDMTSTAQDYLRLGDIRILNNNWGSEDLGCFAPTSTMSVFVNQDQSFGWTFTRGNCDQAGNNQNPDFPQVEFGIHPFGIGDELVTSPEFSSTTLLPMQIKYINSASVTVDNLNIQLQAQSSWNITFEFWVSERDPVNDPDPGVKGELMTFWGWNGGRWPTAPGADGSNHNGGNVGGPDQVGSGGKNYTLWVQSANWASGWEYFQFRDNSGPQQSFNGTVDVKPFLDYLKNTRGYDENWWVTRLEVGSEIDDDTGGTVTMQGITFEINGESRSEVIIP